MRFNPLRICLVLSGMLAFCSGMAQPAINFLRLSAEERGLPEGFTPFGTVELLDNRLDTVTLYSFQDGNFPPSVLQFSSWSAADEIGDYLRHAMNTLHHGSDTLLVNLRQLRMTNKSIRLKKDDTISAYRLRDLRLGFLLVADIYRRKGELYYPLGTFGKLYSPGYNSFAQTIAFGLNEMLTAAGGGQLWYNKRKEDVIAFRRSTNKHSYTLAEINIKAQDSWAHYPVMQANLPADGLFMEWDDFKNNQPRMDDFHLAYDERDSLYHLSVSHKVKSYPWAVADSGVLYIHVLRELYVKTWRCNNTRCFYIPHTLPDMYTLLSIQTGARARRSSGMIYSGGSSGYFLVDLGAILVAASIDAIITGSAERKLKKQGMRSDYRYCYIDMDYGDIIYSDAVPNL